MKFQSVTNIYQHILLFNMICQGKTVKTYHSLFLIQILQFFILSYHNYRITKIANFFFSKNKKQKLNSIFRLVQITKLQLHCETVSSGSIQNQKFNNLAWFGSVTPNPKKKLVVQCCTLISLFRQSLIVFGRTVWSLHCIFLIILIERRQSNIT